MDTITTTQLDETAVRIDIPGVGQFTILRYTDDAGQHGARILELLQDDAAPTTVEPA